MKTETHELPNGKLALTVKDNLDSFNSGSPKFKRLVAYGKLDKHGRRVWKWIHKAFKP